MKKSKNKYSPWPAVALCLVFLALRIVDLALFTDPETSFPTVGPSAARWGAALVGAAALLVMGRRADEKIAPGRKSVLGVMMAVTGTVLVLAGLSAAVERRSGVAQHGAADGGGRVVLRYGLAGSFDPGRAWNRHAAQRRAVPDPYGGAAVGADPAVFPSSRRHRRGLAVPSGCWGRWARCFVWGMLCKLLYVPGGTYGCTVQQYGSLAFYFATCHELPQAIFELVRGSVSEQTLLTSLAMGCIGLCGLAAMLTTVPRSNPTKKR